MYLMVNIDLRLETNLIKPVGLVFAALINSTSRNPSLRPQLFSYTILGFALTEAIGLFALMMAFLLLYAA
jgi:F-type H+-transporting ATPase subunit c